jgi:hypothetical protein
MNDYLNIIQDVKRQINVAECMRTVDTEASKFYASHIMQRAKVSDCGRSPDSMVIKASEICESFLHEFVST